MTSIIGTDPNQVPTNADLGTMAYQDYDAIAPKFANTATNMLINPDMGVSQRGTSWTGITGSNSQYTADRWQLNIGASAGTFSVGQGSDAPSGFPASVSISVTTAATDTNDQAYFRQRLEGRTTYHLAYGTPAAKRTHFSFWVKSNVTGKFPVLLVQHSTAQRDYPMVYEINEADTWEYKSFMVNGDAGGLSAYNSTLECSVDFFLAGTGTTYKSIGAWKARDGNDIMYGVSNRLNSATGRYIKFTGVQWIESEVPVAFSPRHPETELTLCRRYYQNLGNIGFHIWAHGIADTSGIRHQQMTFPQWMRSTPTTTWDDNAGNANRVRYESANKNTNSTNNNVGLSRNEKMFWGGIKYPYGLPDIGYDTNGGGSGFAIAYNMILDAEL